MPLALEVVLRTDPGRDPSKQVNEDAAGHRLTPLGHVLLVCDGMGGHALGEEASRVALGTAVRFLEAASPGSSPAAVLGAALVEAGREVYRLGGASGAGRPGSTCVAVLVHGGGVEIAHVGDSRAYLLRGGRAHRLTKDHSVVQQLIDGGGLTPEEARIHPEANKITRALGMKPETEVERRPAPLACAPGDVLLLATDGLSNLVLDEEIAGACSAAATLEAAAEELVRLANERGGHDNITVLAARVLSAPPRRAEPATPIAPTLVEHPLEGRGAAGRLDPTLPGDAPSFRRPFGSPAVTIRDEVSRRAGPGRPSRSGLWALAAGLTAVALILAGVTLWWLVRGRP